MSTMRLIMDGQEYYVNGGKVMEHLASFYSQKSQEIQVIDVGDGKKLDFTRKSVLRTAMKAAMVPFVVPVMSMLFKLRGLEAPKHTKHEDLIDWMVLRMLEFCSIAEEDVVLHATSEIMENNSSDIRRVVAISTHGSDILNRRRFLPTPEPVQPERLEAGEEV